MSISPNVKGNRGSSLISPHPSPTFVHSVPPFRAFLPFSAFEEKFEA